MFGYHYEIVKECPYYLLDYREETDPNTRWVDRVVSDAATWSGNVFDFYSAVVPKLEFGLKVPFKLEGMIQVDDTSVHQAIRESLVNALVHANYYERQGVVIIKDKDFYRFSNPGLLRIPLEDAVAGGLSDPRNLTIFTMFTLLNIGERAGTGLSNIYSVWKQQDWIKPMLVESFDPERTTLTLMMQKTKSVDRKVARISPYLELR
jgi:ATP-dependent DNA helicase RecG